MVREFQIPKGVVVEEKTQEYGKFVFAPLERGYGLTIGNSLRRILLSSIKGAAIIGCKMEGVAHEFSTIEGAVEDVVQIVLNLKKIRLKAHGEGPWTVSVHFKGEKDKKDFTAGDLPVPHDIEVVSKDVHIVSLEEGAELKMDLFVGRGRGYISAEEIKSVYKFPVDTIYIDGLFSPILKANFRVENTRVGQLTDYDKLILEVWTDGTVPPDEALARAASIMKQHMEILLSDEVGVGSGAFAEVSESTRKEDKIARFLQMKVEELELPVRCANVVKQANIKTIAELVSKTEQEMLKYKNFGKKSLQEMKKVLEAHGLHFGMDVSAYLSPKEVKR